MPTRKKSYVYMLKCKDGTLYTGSTTDLDRRLSQHQNGTASKYTRPRRPVKMVYHEMFYSWSKALKRECAIKTLSRPEKLDLIKAKKSKAKKKKKA